MLSSSDTGQLMEDVLQGRLDLGVCFNLPSRPSTIEEIILYEGKLELVVRKNHPILKLPNSKRLKALSSYPSTVHQSAMGLSGCEAHTMFDKFNIVPDMSFFYNSDQIGLARILGSNAWGFMPDLIIPKGMVKITPDKGWSANFHISIIRRRGVQFDQGLKEIQSIIQSVFN